MSQRSRVLISNMLFHGGKNHMVSKAHFQFPSEKALEYIKHNGNSGGLFKVEPYALRVQVIFSA